MGLRTIVSGGLTALGVVLAATSAHAQQTAPATNPSTATPTPTPGAVGPPELQNFNLDGTVTRETAPTPTPTPTPSPAPSASTPTPAPSPAPVREAAPSSSPTVRQAAPSGPAASASAPTVADPSAILPGQVLAQEAPPSPTTTATDLMPPATPSSGTGIWPWLALAVALAAAGGWWLRRKKDGAEELAYAGNASALETPAPAPAPTPRAPPRAAPQPAPSDGITTRVPSPVQAPSDGITARVPSGPTGFDGGIVSRSLQPKLAFELRPLKFETDGSNNARLTFELLVSNVGSAPARDVRIEAKMFNAGPNQDQQISQFFRAPGAMGAKLPPIGPQDKVPLRSRIGMPANDYQALDLGGRSLVVPMIAVNAIYRGTSGETQESASWLVGALPSGGDAEKLKPFPLDKPVATTALAARQHSTGLQR